MNGTELRSFSNFQILTWIGYSDLSRILENWLILMFAFIPSQALHGLAPKCKLINMHELINKSTNDYVTLLPCENGVNVNNKG